MRGASVQASRASIASTPRGAQVFCVVILSNGRVVSGSYDNTLKVWDVSKGECLRTLSGHIDSVRRQRPFEPRVDRVNAATGAGLMRRWPAELPRRVRVARQHAQGVGRFERQVPPHAERAHGLGAAPASIRTARRLLVDAARGAGPLRRRPAQRPRRVRVGEPHAQGRRRRLRAAGRPRPMRWSARAPPTYQPPRRC